MVDLDIYNPQKVRGIVEAKDKEIVALKKELAESIQQIERGARLLDGETKECNDLKSRCAILEGALNKYGRHLPGCAWQGLPYNLSDTRINCKCGFQESAKEALAGASTGGGDLEKVRETLNRLNDFNGADMASAQEGVYFEVEFTLRDMEGILESIAILDKLLGGKP